MTEPLFTEEDVTTGGRALHTAWIRLDEGLDLFGKDAHRYLARAVLGAVAEPIHNRGGQKGMEAGYEIGRKVGGAEALRQVANDCQPGDAQMLRAHADSLDGGDDE